MLFNVIKRYSMLYQNICAFLWQFQPFFVPSHHQATDPALVHLTKLKRRTFLPAEVNIIYQHLGQP